MLREVSAHAPPSFDRRHVQGHQRGFRSFLVPGQFGFSVTHGPAAFGIVLRMVFSSPPATHLSGEGPREEGDCRSFRCRRGWHKKDDVVSAGSVVPNPANQGFRLYVYTGQIMYVLALPGEKWSMAPPRAFGLVTFELGPDAVHTYLSSTSSVWQSQSCSPATQG